MIEYFRISVASSSVNLFGSSSIIDPDNLLNRSVERIKSYGPRPKQNGPITNYKKPNIYSLNNTPVKV